MLEITPNQIFESAMIWAPHGVVPLFRGPPGIGKSFGVRELADSINCELIDIRLATCSPEDLTGLPMRTDNEKATFAPFDMFPLEGDPLPEGKQGWIIFLDEVTSAGKQMQAAAYKLVLDRLIGNRKLHDNVICIAAGNRATDKAVVNAMSTALQSRFAHYNIRIDNQETIEYMIKAGFDHRITSFLQFRPSLVMNFNPEHTEDTFACPRTWEFLSRAIKGRKIDESFAVHAAAVVGAGAGIEFIGFAQEFDRIPKLENILDDPEKEPVPSELSTKYATITMLAEYIKNDNAKAILAYVARFPSEMKIVFSKNILLINEEFAGENIDFLEFRKDQARYLGKLDAA